MTTARRGQWLTLLVTLLTIGLAAGAFTLSFTALRDLAVKAGIPEPISPLWPLVVDGFIVVATLATIRVRDQRVRWYPWAALGLFAVLSVLGNALHVTTITTEVPAIIAVLVSAVPAIALLVATHLALIMLTPRDRDADDAAQIALETPAQVAPTLLDEQRFHGLADATEQHQPAEQNDALEVDVPQPVAALVAWAEQHDAQLDAATAATILGRSPRTARRWLAHVRTHRPDLVTTSGE